MSELITSSFCFGSKVSAPRVSDPKIFLVPKGWSLRQVWILMPKVLVRCPNGADSIPSRKALVFISVPGRRVRRSKLSRCRPWPEGRGRTGAFFFGKGRGRESHYSLYSDPVLLGLSCRSRLRTRKCVPPLHQLLARGILHGRNLLQRYPVRSRFADAFRDVEPDVHGASSWIERDRHASQSCSSCSDDKTQVAHFVQVGARKLSATSGTKFKWSLFHRLLVGPTQVGPTAFHESSDRRP